MIVDNVRLGYLYGFDGIYMRFYFLVFFLVDYLDIIQAVGLFGFQYFFKVGDFVRVGGDNDFVVNVMWNVMSLGKIKQVMVIMGIIECFGVIGCIVNVRVDDVIVVVSLMLCYVCSFVDYGYMEARLFFS